MSGSRERTSSKRGRHIHHSGSTSNFGASQEALAPSRSTPSFNYASSRCMDEPGSQEQILAEIADINVGAIWLEGRDNQQYLLLEDSDTGDVLMPLTKLKEMLGGNYSRALYNTDNRFVIKNPNVDFGPHDPGNNLYWMWPFESPPHVKSLIRRELREYSAGHVKLVLVPVAYNAMAKIHQDALSKKRADPRLTPTFLELKEALERTLYNSSYAPFLHLPLEPEAYGLREGEQVAFHGPKDMAATAAKYMSTHKIVSRKKPKLEPRTGLAAVSKQELEQIAKQETAGIAELKAQVQGITEQVKRQDKRLEQICEDLKETKSLFSRIFEVFTASIMGAPQAQAALPQVHSVPDMDKAWQVDQSGRYLLPPRAKSATAAQGYRQFTNVPAISTAFEQQLVASALQQPIACPQFLSLTQQLGQLPVQSGPAFPVVANTGHHLMFPDPKTPGTQDPASSNYRGTEKPTMVGASMGTEQLKPNANPTYEDYMRHVYPFKSGMQMESLPHRQEDVTTMF